MSRLPFLALAFVAGAACAQSTPSPSPSSTATVASVLSSGKSSPAATLDRMDTRAPVPLLPMMAMHQKENMRDHLVAVQQIVMALASDNFAEVEIAAGRLGSSDSMHQTCTHMGAGAPGFTDQALGFHQTADGIVAAARDRDKARVLSALSATLQTCTSCHATWKQQIVDDSTWQLMTASEPPGHDHSP